MRGFFKRHLKAILAAMVLAPVAWAIFEEPGKTDEPELPPAPVVKKRPRPLEIPKPADVSRPRPAKPAEPEDKIPRRRIQGVVHPFRSEPLDAAARTEGEKILATLRARWRKEWEATSYGAGCCGYSLGGFASAEFLIAPRLFAQGYPELAEGWAQRVCEFGYPSWENGRAVEALLVLARHHFGAAESVLRRLCRSSVDYLRWRARTYLIFADREMRLALAREGDPPHAGSRSAFYATRGSARSGRRSSARRPTP